MRIYQVNDTYCDIEQDILDMVRELRFGDTITIKMLEMDEEEWKRMR